MSDYYISYIPNDPHYVPAENQRKRLSKFKIPDCTTALEIKEVVTFADAGENFERVTCPYCNANIFEWWKDAMDKAYSSDKGFSKLGVTMPCCGKDSTLNDLNYYFPQGLYRTRILCEPSISAQINIDGICADLETISGVHWRAIHQYL